MLFNLQTSEQNQFRRVEIYFISQTFTITTSKHVITLIKISLSKRMSHEYCNILYSKFLHNIEWHIIALFIHEKMASEMAENKQEILASVHYEY